MSQDSDTGAVRQCSGEAVQPPASAHTPARVPGRPFVKGYDPRRNMDGRRYGQSMLESINTLGHTAHENGGRPWLEGIAADEAEPWERRTAADILLRTREEGFSKGGKPLAGDDIDRVLDRDLGKPAQHVVLEAPPAKTPEEIMAAIRAFEAEHPELLQHDEQRALPPA